MPNGVPLQGPMDTPHDYHHQASDVPGEGDVLNCLPVAQAFSDFLGLDVDVGFLGEAVQPDRNTRALSSI